MVKIGVLISGGGTNLQAIIDGCKNKSINGEVKVVISNKAEAYGLERAKKNNIKAIWEKEEDRIIEIKGRDLITGLPKIIEVSESQIREALKEPVYAIIESIKTTLEKTPPELAADIMEKGIMLAGGGALLKGLDVLIGKETNMPVHIAESLLTV